MNGSDVLSSSSQSSCEVMRSIRLCDVSISICFVRFPGPLVLSDPLISTASGLSFGPETILSIEWMP